MRSRWAPPVMFVLVSPAIFNVVAPDSEEPIEDVLFPNVGSTSDVPSEIAFYVNERVGASTDGSKMIRITADGVDPAADLAYGSEVAVVVDEGAFRDMAGHETGLRF